MKRTILIFAAVFILSGLAHAQRRVITNDDVSPAPVPAPAPAEAQAAAASPARESDSADATATAATPNAPAAALPRTPQADLNRLKAIQATLMGLNDEYAVKANDERNPDWAVRWREVLDQLGSIIRSNQEVINELQMSLGLPPADPGALPDSSQSAPAPASPAPPAN